MMWQHSFNFLSHYMMPDGTYPTTDDRWNDLTADAWVSGARPGTWKNDTFPIV